MNYHFRAYGLLVLSCVPAVGCALETSQEVDSSRENIISTSVQDRLGAYLILDQNAAGDYFYGSPDSTLINGPTC